MSAARPATPPLPLRDWPIASRAGITHVFTDIDDTLTTHGRLPATAYTALERLSEAGFSVIPITGRPAGWCDHIARMWPVAGVVGENGAFWFRHDQASRKLIRRFADEDTAVRAAKRRRLEALATEILQSVPGPDLASDQNYRESDLAIDFCEDVAPLPDEAIERILALFHQAGATAKVSSIHVNGWFGDYDKLTMTALFTREALGTELDDLLERAVYAGDSPNDEPMFAHFTHSVGVANLARFLPRLRHQPRYLAAAEGGEGFAELAQALLAART